ncbi:MAG: septum formation protein Maf [Deltaproteobacteria bacterium RBG_13_52_11]|nr:MAG: septum formation protein Maf [Deltaproteobacteria bacterium RBG_13_52_11]
MSQQLILASSSPRRRDLLSSLGLQFQVVPAALREIPSPHEAAKDFAVRVAEKKALAVGNKYPHAWVIGADTVVAVEGEILGKPRDREDAKKMLQQLANREHVVITGYTLMKVAEGKTMRGVEETRVKISSLDEREIEWYINTGEPFDKAGGYAIQGKGAFMVEWIEGSYTNVVGLPLCQLIRLFKDVSIVDIF